MFVICSNVQYVRYLHGICSAQKILMLLRVELDYNGTDLEADCPNCILMRIPLATGSDNFPELWRPDLFFYYQRSAKMFDLLAESNVLNYNVS